jgi:hypothetical protein
MPAPKSRPDDAYFVPPASLKVCPYTALYLGLIHHADDTGNVTRLAVARRHIRVDGVAPECGMARDDPSRWVALLAAHVTAEEMAHEPR